MKKCMSRIDKSSGFWILINVVLILFKVDIAFEQVDITVSFVDLFDLVFWEGNLDDPFYFIPQFSRVNNMTCIIVVI